MHMSTVMNASLTMTRLAALFAVTLGLSACGQASHELCGSDEDCDAEQTCVDNFLLGDPGGICKDLGDVGEDCYVDTYCRSDLVCRGRSMEPSGELGYGRCAPPAALDEACVADSDCRPRTAESHYEGPAFCDENGATPVCRENGTTPDGDACEAHVECRDGSLCSSLDADGTCTPADGKLDSPCHGGSGPDACEPGLYCDAVGQGVGLCRALVAGGGACWGGDCVDGFACNVGNECQALPEGAIWCWGDSVCPADRPRCAETDGLMLCQPAN
jgi:hypothetical protein